MNAVNGYNPIYLKELIRTGNAYSGDISYGSKKHDRSPWISPRMIIEILHVDAPIGNSQRTQEMNITEHTQLYKIWNIFTFHNMSYNLDKYTYFTGIAYSLSYTFNDIKDYSLH